MRTKPNLKPGDQLLAQVLAPVTVAQLVECQWTRRRPTFAAGYLQRRA